MNIFASSTDPFEAAEMLDDKRMIKMILESTQLLCSAINLNGGSAPYKTTHKNHPCTLWAARNSGNWLWLWMHANSLCHIYENTYKKQHKCYAILELLLRDKRYVKYLKHGELETFVNCTSNSLKGISFKHLNDPVEAYREYLSARWDSDKRPPTWTNRPKPKWYRGVYA